VYKTTSVPIDNLELSKVAPEFTELVRNKPDFALGCLSIALAKVLIFYPKLASLQIMI
jgi:hypothetical protein